MAETGTEKLTSGLFKAWLAKLDADQRSRFASARFRILLLFLLLLLLITANLLVASGSDSAIPLFLASAILPINLIALVATLILFYMIWRHLLDPLLKLSQWGDSMRAVNLDARVEFATDSDFSVLGKDINMLGNMINQLSRDTETQLQKYTDHISRESKSLAILYDVASSINISRDLNQLFEISLQSMCINLNAAAGIIRQFKAKGKQEVVASYGQLNNTFLSSVDQFLSIDDSASSNNTNQVNQIDNLPRSTVFALSEEHNKETIIALSVKVKYRDETLGAIHLFFENNADADLANFHHLLVSIGQHLGTAVEKFRLLEDESQLLIIQERTRLSDELHDSLAQTIASLRIQLRVIEETTASDDRQGTVHQLERMEFTIEQANNQLRELIAHFRIPLHKQGLISAIEEAIQACKDESAISVYFQNEWPNRDISAEVELNLLRIVQESLVNVRKHSKANTVRISLTVRDNKNILLIEDDGVGFDESTVTSTDGHHIGLKILRERASQIGGIIEIESEPGEGTRIHLQFTINEADSSR